MVLGVAGEDLECNVNRKQRNFFSMRHGCFVVRGGIYELLFEVFQLKDHGFGLI